MRMAWNRHADCASLIRRLVTSRKWGSPSMRKPFLAVALAVGLGQAAIGSAAAQVYPSRPITLVVPYPAGGPSDTLARILGESLRSLLGQPIIIENVSGAGGA